jgi:hypothetical protein
VALLERQRIAASRVSIDDYVVPSDALAVADVLTATAGFRRLTARAEIACMTARLAFCAARSELWLAEVVGVPLDTLGAAAVMAGQPEADLGQEILKAPADGPVITIVTDGEPEPERPFELGGRYLARG